MTRFGYAQTGQACHTSPGRGPARAAGSRMTSVSAMRRYRMTRRLLFVIVLGLVIFLPSPRPLAQSSATVLSALDRIEIEQLAIRYTYALDTGTDNGYMYADVFTPDGEFVGRQVPLTQGREALARVARSVRKANSM